MESHDVYHDEDQTGECHSSNWEGRLNSVQQTRDK